MTVEQLVRLLRDYPPDLRVVVDGYEDGYDDLSAGAALCGQNRPGHRETPLGRATRRPERSSRRCRSGRSAGVATRVELRASDKVTWAEVLTTWP